MKNLLIFQTQTMQKSGIFFIFLTLLACESAEEKYDRESGQTEVLTRAGINDVLSGFEKISFDQLGDAYLDYTDPDKKFRKEMKGLTWYQVEGDEIYKFIVGKFRISNFLCTDQYFVDNRDNIEANHKQYWLVDKKMLFMILDFIYALDEKGYDKYGFQVRESHRHPAYNEERGGASLSQHIYGRAADLVIEDINADGSITDQDKEIALEILEGIVDDNGGMGLYPGTMTIHIDSRGYAARWDSYKRPN